MDKLPYIINLIQRRFGYSNDWNDYVTILFQGIPCKISPIQRKIGEILFHTAKQKKPLSIKSTASTLPVIKLIPLVNTPF
ncbi:Hypothetical protein Tpal_241 [Trichococcus palustris]|uniref:Uncharacterized protein n=1 Tax=Trichococcus palustris TaxID=140314 RepID=A0A143Y7I1_9LACT|nr:Hypothetical protein Tpal_241 [Trichococcus palustris]SFK61765.1 hypothetical protein SAMN04488076_10249 [Trichococcus palustris]